MLKENLSLKLLALCLTLFIWFQNVLFSEHKSTVQLPVSLINIPQNLTYDNLPNKIPFVVKGRGIDIVKLYLHKARIELDARNIRPGLSTLSVNDYNIIMPENLDIDLLGPVEDKELMIRSDVFHRKSVPVALSFTDTATKNLFDGKEHRIFPEKIQVFGPKNKIQKIGSISTHKISKNLLNQDEFKIDLIIPDDDISISDQSIKVTIIDEESSSKVFANIIIRTDKHYKLIPPRVTVILKGSSSELQSVRADMISASVSGEPDAEGAFQVNVKAPDNVMLMDITPAKVYLLKE